LAVHSIPTFQPDDFTVTAVEPWFKVKVQVIKEYLQAFVAQTYGRADEIVFIDLLAGSGFYSYGYQKMLIPMACLEALQTDPPFTKLIFCESDPEAAKALKIRVNKYFRGRNVVLFDHQPEEMPEKLRLYVPASKRNFKVASICLVDPFSLKFSFDLLSTLAAQGYSFLIPYTLPLNTRTDFRFYLTEEGEKVRTFLGHNESSVFASNNNVEFYKKLVRVHQNNMLTLGLTVSLSAHKLESKMMDLPIFYVGMFSRQISAKSVGRDVRENNQRQFELF
jgi:three-Cys-motif partner protein